MVGAVSLKRFFPWPVLTIKSNKIHSVQICQSGPEVGLNHFPFDLTFKVKHQALEQKMSVWNDTVEKRFENEAF